MKEVDLTTYLDDTNLARLVSGTVDPAGIATFKRDDNSTFTVDFSSFKQSDSGNAQWVNLNLLNGSTAARARYKVIANTVVFDLYDIKTPESAPFVLFNLPVEIRPSEDRYIGGVVRLTTSENYVLIVRKNGDALISSNYLGGAHRYLISNEYTIS